MPSSEELETFISFCGSLIKEEKYLSIEKMRTCQTIELEKEMFVHIIIRVKIAVGSLADMKVDEKMSRYQGLQL